MRLLLTRTEWIGQLGTPVFLLHLFGWPWAIGEVGLLLMVWYLLPPGTKKSSKWVCSSFDYAMKAA